MSVLLQAKLLSHLKRMTLNCMTARASRRRWRGRKRGREKRRKTTVPWTHSTPPVKRGRGSITHPLLCRTIQLWSTWHNSHRHHVHSHSSPQHFYSCLMCLICQLSLVPRPRPAFRRYLIVCFSELQATESWAGPGNEATVSRREARASGARD